MNRTARVARTAHDLTHVNRLHVPQFGVMSLWVAGGDKLSKSYLIDTAPKQKAEPKSTDDFCFAPEKDKVKIKYKIDDWAGSITKATLELFHRDQVKEVWKKDLTEEEYAHGERELEWDGKIDKGTDFPEEYITVEHSPYKLKLTVEGEGHNHSPAAWTYLHVLIHELELELGDKKSLTEKRDKDLYDVLGALPAKDSTTPLKVPLITNDFSNTSADKTDATLHTQLDTLWGDGPNIPIFVKPWIRNMAGTKEWVPKAIGKVKFLWDWEDVPEDTSALYKQGKEWIGDALDYSKKATAPKGDNCHADRDGKRGSTTKFVFPAQGGYDPEVALRADTFPFPVERCTTRKQSSYSTSWRSGEVMGKSGVLFQPARMAGDAYKVHVYFPHNRKPDGKDELDVVEDKDLEHAVTQKTGIFQIWREVHIVSYTKKAGLANLNLRVGQKYYTPAYMEILDKTNGTTTTIANWDATIRGKLNTLSAEKQCAVEPGDQGTLTTGAIMCRRYADFKTALKATKAVWTAGEFDTLLAAESADTLAGYKDYCEAIADATVPKACSGFLVDNGINIIHFQRYWETTDGVESTTLGFASLDFDGLTHSKCGYLEVGDYSGLTINGIDKTTGHEIGHTLYMPHAYDAGGYSNALHDLDSHWHYCLMTYTDDKENHFCGLCMVRLRGWKSAGLQSDRKQNKQ